jgi:hypothetical protein
MIQAVGGAVIAALGAVMVTSYLATSLRGRRSGSWRCLPCSGRHSDRSWAVF